ncbi:cytochrome P450 [Rhodocollybia butyracea]|uniref:Cytochrome P450 n=1 Tax=Rhodocollybia butyracea TaxID=206335 RepID=A0A9P5UC71_9AGAR|nr:cytochrome P450 [Rhodocollybia butyracea]
MSLSVFNALFAAAGFTLLVVLLRKRTHRLPLPPGPQGYPLIGNALDIPAKYPWLTYFEWSKTFGDVIHISALGQSIIILNSAEAISDLLERKSSIYSDRPLPIMAGELVGYKDSPIMFQNGPRHREFRRLFSEVLSARKVKEWRPVQEPKVGSLLKGLAGSPIEFHEHIRLFVASLIFELSHGHIVQDEDDPLLKMAKQVDNDYSELVIPGNFLVDVFPFLRYVPEWTGVKFKRKAAQFRQTITEAVDWPYQQVKDQIATGTALPSFTQNLIENTENLTKENEKLFKWAAMVFFTAGADTSVSALSSFILAMALHPEKQRKAQEEIDRLVGTERRPTFEDRSQLPYVESIIKEVYRWNPVGPIAVPHKLSSDTTDEYRQWRIPKGSVVIANSWAVMHNEEIYPSPFEFSPERYLGRDPSGNQVNPDPRKFAFGYGRRVCPGQALADDTVYIAVVSILTLFNVGPLKSEDAPKYTPYLISHPEAFECDITPRTRVS